MPKPSETVGVVYVFSDGHCEVYSEAGRRMPQYEGQWEEMRQHMSVRTEAVIFLERTEGIAGVIRRPMRRPLQRPMRRKGEHDERE